MFTQSNFYTEKSLHREEAWPHRRFHPQHTKRVYTQKLVHREAFTHIFAHRNFYAEELLRTEAFTHREVLTQTKLCDFARPQFHPSFCRLTFMSCEMVASAISQSHFYVRSSRLTFISCEMVAPMISKLQFSLSFWRSAIISCERAMPGHQKFDHTSVRPTRAISAEGCAGERKIRTSLFTTLARPARTISAHRTNRIRMSPPVCDFRRGVLAPKTNPHFTIPLCPRRIRCP